VWGIYTCFHALSDVNLQRSSIQKGSGIHTGGLKLKKVFQVLRFFVGITLIVFFTAIADAATLEVGEGKPYTSIQAAITDAVAGDTVLVYDGTYVEQINFMGKAITVKSMNGAASTIIDGNAGGTVVTFINGEGSGSVLDGFTITNGNSGSNGGGVLCGASSPIITNCKITENTASTYGGGIFSGNSSPTILNCIITGNTASVDGGGIYVGGMHVDSSSPTISNSVITGNAAGNNGGGIGAGGSSPTILNCIITGNTASVDGGGIYCGSSSPGITNCTITGNTAGNTGGAIFGGGSSPTISNGILWANIALGAYNEIAQISSTIACTYSNIDQDGYAGSDGNIWQDPRFVDPVNGNFHLQPDSPCIDAGTSDGAPSADMEGFSRYDEPLVPNTGGGTYPYYDMGAYESQMRVVTPIDGTIGTVLTINGSGFGDRKGKVLINGIPAKIAKEDWSPTQITCTIKKPPLPVEVAHPVSVVVNRVPTLLDGTFTLRGLVLDELLTSSGAHPDPIKITGMFFGIKKVKVYLYNPLTEKKKRLKVTDWKMNETTGVSELTFVVPKPSRSFPAGSYQLRVENKIGPASTSPDFELLEPVP